MVRGPKSAVDGRGAERIGGGRDCPVRPGGWGCGAGAGERGRDDPAELPAVAALAGFLRAGQGGPGAEGFRRSGGPWGVRPRMGARGGAMNGGAGKSEEANLTNWPHYGKLSWIGNDGG